MHVIHLDASVAFGIVSHNILTREIRKTGTDESNRSYKGVDSLKWKRTGEPQAPTLTPILFSRSLT